MENIPRIIDTVRLSVAIPIHAYLLDHHVEGQVVLPAVIAMQVIGETVKRFWPDTDISVMTRVRFDKFLHIPSGTDIVDALVVIDMYDNGDIRAGLRTKNRFKKSSMIRTKEHASAYYRYDQVGFADPQPVAGAGSPEYQNTKIPKYIQTDWRAGGQDGRMYAPASDLLSALKGDFVKISSERIYGELVPFGPAFHSIHGDILISEYGVIAEIGTPATYNVGAGSPFPLDAAYHCACVWGQRYARMVAFPVGFEKRTVWRNTQPGEVYFCRVLPVETHPDILIFDLWIVDENEVLFESNLGVCMKDVSSGRMKPPQWIMKL